MWPVEHQWDNQCPQLSQVLRACGADLVRSGLVGDCTYHVLASVMLVLVVVLA